MTSAIPPGRVTAHPGYLLKRAQAALNAAMAGALRGHGATLSQYAVLTALDEEPGLSNAGLARRSFVTPQTMNQVLRELEKAMPPDSMVSTDIGNICSVANSYLRFDGPRSMFAAMSFGNCGYAFPVICGAKIASPQRPGFAYVGDGAWGISFNELLTCAREKIGVTVVVFNNAQWGAEKKNHVDFYSRRYQGVNLENPSWAAVARAFGCEGVTVDRLADVGPALREAAEAQREQRTTVLEMMVTQELGDPFRRDALTKPVRFLQKYKAFD